MSTCMVFLKGKMNITFALQQEYLKDICPRNICTTSGLCVLPFTGIESEKDLVMQRLALFRLKALLGPTHICYPSAGKCMSLRES